MTASTTDTTGVYLLVPIDEVSPHPDNVRDKIGDVTGLATSITEVGILEPPVVVTVTAFREHATPAQGMGTKAGTNYVVYDGHRRLAAARKAKLAELWVIVRDDLAAKAVTAMIIANLQHEQLSAMEEARALGRLRDTGMTERAIAKATGISPGQVHKRLSLRRLPGPIAAAIGTTVDDEEFSVTSALKLLELPDDEIVGAWDTWRQSDWRKLPDVVDSRLRDLEIKKRLAETRKAVEQRGIEIVESAREVLGNAMWDHQYPDGTTAEQIDNPDDTIAVLGSGGTTVFYSRTIPIPDEDEPIDTASGGSAPAPAPRHAAQDKPHDPQVDADREAGEKAAALRAEACQRILHGTELDDDALAAEILADYLLFNADLAAYDAVPRATEWLGTPLDIAADATWAERNGAEESWVDEQANTGGLAAIRGAVAVVLADNEKCLPAVRDHAGRLGEWSPRDIRHVHRLVEYADHELTEIEQRVIEHSQAQHAAAADESTPDVGAGDG